MTELRGTWLAVTVGTLLCLSRAGAAQAPAGNVVIEEARTPSSPAFVLLGVEPTAIERPNTPRALALSLLSATGNGSLLPRDYALEVAPYWLSRHPQLTFDRYYHPGFGQTVLQSLSLSLATARGGDSSATGDSATVIALGLRTLLHAGGAAPELADERARLDSAQGHFLEVIDSLDQVREAQDGLPGDCAAGCLTQREALRAAGTRLASDSVRLLASLKTIALGIQQLDHQRVGWQIEMAAALSGRFPGDAWDRAEVGRLGVWVTPSYRPAGDDVEFLAVGRFIHSFRTGTQASLLDVGGRVRWEKGPLAASGEFVFRSRNPLQGATTSSVRAVGQFDYRVSGDFHVMGSFGKNYDGDTPGAKQLVTQLGIDLGLGPIPLIGLGH